MDQDANEPHGRQLPEHISVLSGKEISIDLSHKNLILFPVSLFSKCVNLQCLYLDGNKITQLEDDFFHIFPKLVWLDLRNNELETVPTSVANHQCLQVLLLEGNRIERLPVELGSVPNLRGLQLAKNPITYPPENIISKGSQSIIKFLKNEYELSQKKEILEPVSGAYCHAKTLFQQENSDTPKVTKEKPKSAFIPHINSHQPRKPRKAYSGNIISSLRNCISIKQIMQPQQSNTYNVLLENWNSENVHRLTDEGEEYAAGHLNQANPSNQYFIVTNKVPSKRDIKYAEKVQSKMVYDMWYKRICDILQSQEKILQQMRNKDALKQWQTETEVIKQQKNSQYKPEAVEPLVVPYDTDPEYRKVISREELIEQIKSCVFENKKKIHQTPKSKLNIDDQIVALMKILNGLQNERRSEDQPMTSQNEQKYLAAEIKMIKDVQKTLHSLRLKEL